MGKEKKEECAYGVSKNGEETKVFMLRELQQNEIAYTGVKLARLDSWFYLLFALVGIVASGALLVSEIHLYKYPLASLSCDVNELVGCGSIIKLPQSHLLFGLPNALFGLMAFAALSMLAFLQIIGVTWAYWFDYLLLSATLIALGYVFYFQYQSVLVLRELCPWCFVTWLVTVGLFVLTWANVGRKSTSSLASFGWNNRWVIIIVWWALIIAVLILVWWDKWQIVLAR